MVRGGEEDVEIRDDDDDDVKVEYQATTDARSVTTCLIVFTAKQRI